MAIKIAGTTVIDDGRCLTNVINHNANKNNFFAGTNAGACNTTGDNNIFIGGSTGACNTTGNDNIFFGRSAGACNTTGYFNTFIGAFSGLNNTTGSFNNFIGLSAGYNNTTGNHNNFLGCNAGYCNTTGNSNFFLGFAAGYYNTSGCNNIFFGCNAGCAVTTGINNVIIGSIAGTADLSNTIILAAGACEYARINSTGMGIGTTNPQYKLEVNGSFAATTKSFLINHPTKEGMKLRYGSLEGPENGVYVRGRLSGTNTISLPDYWSSLVDENTITVHLTPIRTHQNLVVANITDNTVTVKNDSFLSSRIDCFYTVYAERKDVDKLVVELDK